MPGDKFEINASSYYEGENMPEETVEADDVVSSLLGALTGGVTLGGTPVAELPENVQMVQDVLGNVNLPAQLSNIPVSNESEYAPKAYLNVLFFDDKLELIPGSSKKIQVPANSGNWTTVQQGTNITPSVICNNCPPGFVIIYVDNQSIGKDVWFDNLFVGHYTSNVLEENHYYPYGLTLSYNAGGLTTGQPYKFGTKELEKSFGLELYDFGARPYDPQIGRWLSVDPLSELMRRHSPYNYAFNNPIRFVDPDGMSPTDYYNLKADMVKHVEDGSKDKKLVLTHSGKESKVNSAIDNGAVSDVPTNAAVDQMEDAFDRGENNGNEFGFVIGEDGQTSKTVEGTSGVIGDKEWRAARADLAGKESTGATDAHLHPLEKDESGRVVNYGKPEPSAQDKTSPIYPNSGKPEIVLGYIKKQRNPHLEV